MSFGWRELKQRPPFLSAPLFSSANHNQQAQISPTTLAAVQLSLSLSPSRFAGLFRLQREEPLELAASGNKVARELNEQQDLPPDKAADEYTLAIVFVAAAKAFVGLTPINRLSLLQLNLRRHLHLTRLSLSHSQFIFSQKPHSTGCRKVERLHQNRRNCDRFASYNQIALECLRCCLLFSCMYVALHY